MKKKNVQNVSFEFISTTRAVAIQQISDIGLILAKKEYQIILDFI